MSAWKPEDLRALEALIDRYTVSGTLEAVAEICHEKAEHIASNWQDVRTAKTWTAVALKINTLSQKTGI